MNKKIVIFASVIGLMVLQACDEGRLYEQETVIAPEGRTVTVKARLTGIASWPDPSMYVVVAGFNDDSDYALINKSVPAPSEEGGEVTVQLSGIKEQVTRVELCVINRLRKHIVSFYTIDEAQLAASNEIEVDAGTLNVGMYHTIQERVFNSTCVNCHGAATSAAAGLYLGTQGILVALGIALVTGSIGGLAQKKFSGSSKFAFGPYLSLGVAVSIFFGDVIGDWYMRITGLYEILEITP